MQHTNIFMMRGCREDQLESYVTEMFMKKMKLWSGGHTRKEWTNKKLPHAAELSVTFVQALAGSTNKVRYLKFGRLLLSRRSCC